MQQQSSKSAIDITPWPTGEGFQGNKDWWEYVWTQKEVDRLDSLLLAALLSREICTLLLNHDEALLKAFNLSEETVTHLSQIEAQTLEGFVQAMKINTNNAIT
ncbi:MAG: hypothetical protein ABI690_12975 [Chloroflexota bacterium]